MSVSNMNIEVHIKKEPLDRVYTETFPSIEIKTDPDRIEPKFVITNCTTCGGDVPPQLSTFKPEPGIPNKNKKIKTETNERTDHETNERTDCETNERTDRETNERTDRTLKRAISLDNLSTSTSTPKVNSKRFRGNYHHNGSRYNWNYRPRGGDWYHHRRFNNYWHNSWVRQRTRQNFHGNKSHPLNSTVKTNKLENEQDLIILKMTSSNQGASCLPSDRVCQNSMSDVRNTNKRGNVLTKLCAKELINSSQTCSDNVLNSDGVQISLNKRNINNEMNNNELLSNCSEKIVNDEKELDCNKDLVMESELENAPIIDINNEEFLVLDEVTEGSNEIEAQPLFDIHISLESNEVVAPDNNSAASDICKVMGESTNVVELLIPEEENTADLTNISKWENDTSNRSTGPNTPVDNHSDTEENFSECDCTSTPDCLSVISDETEKDVQDIENLASKLFEDITVLQEVPKDEEIMCILNKKKEKVLCLKCFAENRRHKKDNDIVFVCKLNTQRTVKIPLIDIV